VSAVRFYNSEEENMRRILRHRPSPALVIACIALTIALGGTSYAAITLPRNSVGTAQLKTNAVNSAKVKNRSLRAIDFRRGQLPRGARGPQGAQGIQGIQGTQGAQGAQGIQGLKGDKGDAGAPGSAVAYAFVKADGTLDTARSKNVASVTHPTTGAYCFDVTVPVVNAVASTGHIGGQFDASAEVVIRPETATFICDEAHKDVLVASVRGSTNSLQDNDVMVVMN
jgi:hypothetical protein